MFWNTIILALRAIRRNLLRSFLTVLGIVIGVAAVIVMVTLGDGATTQVTQQIASLGSNLLMITTGKRMGPGMSTSNPPFRIEDVLAIEREVPDVAAVAPIVSKSMTAIAGNANWSTNVTGSDNQFFPMGNRIIRKGRIFSESEIRSGAAVCVIGETVRKNLFGAQDPLGAKIRLQKLSCEVIGFLEPKGQSSMGQDQDDIVVIPLRTFQRRISGNQDISLIGVSAREGVPTEKVKADLERLMRERRHITANKDDDFNVLDMKEIANMLSSTTKVLTGLLGAVAAVSLLVGGIGIMNIMLVSVTERTREIGIRLAIGALEGEVLLQFLVEAVVLSTLGGIIGVILALIGSYWLAGLLDVPFVFSPMIIFIALFFSMAVGLVFGYFPALKAARMDPIEALRYE